MKNQYGYNCPLDWTNVPEEINYITMEYYHLRNNKSTICIPKLLIVGHVSAPYIIIHKKVLRWASEHKPNDEFISVISDIDVSKLLLEINGGYVLKHSKCIWQRPQP
jgi:hypothetical protein